MVVAAPETVRRCVGAFRRATSSYRLPPPPGRHGVRAPGRPPPGPDPRSTRCRWGGSGVDLVEDGGQQGLGGGAAFGRQGQVRPDHERDVVVRVVADEGVEAGEFTAVVVHRGVRTEALVGDAVPVLLSVGRGRVLGLRAAPPLLLERGVQDLSRHQGTDPGGQLVRGGDGAAAWRGRGRGRRIGERRGARPGRQDAARDQQGRARCQQGRAAGGARVPHAGITALVLGGPASRPGGAGSSGPKG